MIFGPGRSPATSCMVCGSDLWDVGRYASAGMVLICQSCVDVLKAAMDDAEAGGETDVVVPPRVHGPAPDADAAQAIAMAFALTYRTGFDDVEAVLEDAAELAPLMAEGEQRRGGGAQYGARVDAVRFVRPDLAEVRYRIVPNGNPTGFAFEGTAVLRDGHWMVSRETVVRALASIGIVVPPRRP